MSRQTKRAGDREGFVSEAALCETLAAAVRANGWRWYPETSKWDAIIVLPDDTQIGVQAKLRGNVDVLAQALPELGQRGWPPRVLRASEVPGPDKRVVLVPDADGAFRALANHLRLGVLRGRVLRGDEGEWFGYDGTIGASTLRAGEYLARVVEDAPRWEHSQREWLPPFEPERAAGVPSPSAISPWRITAAKLCAEIRAGLEPTAKELEARGMSVSRWRTWLDPIEGTKPRRYKLRNGTYLPDTAWSDVARGLGLAAPPRPHHYDAETGRFGDPEPTWDAAWLADEAERRLRIDAYNEQVALAARTRRGAA